MANPNETLLRDSYDQFIKGGIGAVIHLWDDNGVFHIFGRKSPLAKDWHGKYGISDFFRQMLDMCAGSFELEVIDVLASDERGVVFVHERARRDGRIYEVDTVHVWRLRNGMFTEFWRYVPDLYADEDFWS
jgi:ketosteroid isomerase-like protein